MRQSKTCGEPCAVCDGCIETHDAALKAELDRLKTTQCTSPSPDDDPCAGIARERARVAVLEAKIAEAAKLIRPACQFEGEAWFTTSELIAIARMVWAVLATDALAGRKEG